MKPYHLVTGSIFAFVAIIHILRIINQWPLVIGPWNAPMTMSWVGLIITASLSIWSFRLIRII